MASWKDVWAARRVNPEHGSHFAQIMAADGLDTKFGSVTEHCWREFVRSSARKLGIAPGCSVFEVGCGAGAYLMDLYDAGCEVAGLDASNSLLRYAAENMPRGRWIQKDAVQLDPIEQFDYVISCAVFLYFPSLRYAADVLARMAAKARRGIMILDVPDAAKEQEALAFRRRLIGEAAYAEHYEGLNHLYYSKDWFETTVRNLGLNPVQMEDQSIEGYANSAFRYNVYAWREE